MFYIFLLYFVLGFSLYAIVIVNIILKYYMIMIALALDIKYMSFIDFFYSHLYILNPIGNEGLFFEYYELIKSRILLQITFQKHIEILLMG